MLLSAHLGNVRAQVTSLALARPWKEARDCLTPPTSHPPPPSTIPKDLLPLSHLMTLGCLDPPSFPRTSRSTSPCRISLHTAWLAAELKLITGWVCLPLSSRVFMAWLGDGGGGKVQLVKEIPGHQPWGLEKENRKRRKQEERGSGEENQTKKERKEEIEGEKREMWRRTEEVGLSPVWTTNPATASKVLGSLPQFCGCRFTLWMQNNFLDSGEVANHQTREHSVFALTFPSLSIPSLPSVPFLHLTRFHAPFPTTPYSPHFSSQQNKSTFSPTDLLSLSIKCAEQARHTMFFLLGGRGAWWMGEADASSCTMVDSSAYISSLWCRLLHSIMYLHRLGLFMDTRVHRL